MFKNYDRLIEHCTPDRFALNPYMASLSAVIQVNKGELKQVSTGEGDCGI